MSETEKLEAAITALQESNAQLHMSLMFVVKNLDEISEDVNGAPFPGEEMAQARSLVA